MNYKEKLFNFYKQNITKYSRGKGYGKKYPIKFFLKKTKSALRPEFCQVLGHTMYLDKHDSLDLSVNGIYNELDTKIVTNHIRPNDVVIDIGAHIGYYSLIFAKLVGPHGHVFSFEPEPSNFKLLEKNIKINNYKNITIAQKAVSNKNTKSNLYVGQQSSGANRLYEPKKKFTQDFKITEVDCLELDSFLPIVSSKINFIKIDIEGSEYNALLGMKKIIEKNTNLIIFTEFDPIAIADSGENSEKVIDFLINQGFDIFIVDENLQKLVRTNKKDLLNIKFQNKTINLLCKKNI